MAYKNSKNRIAQNIPTTSYKYSGLYRSWSEMKRRCNNPNATRYHLWGGRGIRYSPEWETFDGFYKDMGATYKAGLQLDRIDNDGNYGPDNCRWATRSEQVNNRSNSRKITHAGLTLSFKEWANLTGVRMGTLQQRFYGYNWSIAKTLKEYRPE
jgi:hypothetical protein